MDYDFVLYYDVCASCKNTLIGRVKNIALRELGEGGLDERYIYALPMWREEAETIGAKMPFIYQISTGHVCELSEEEGDLASKISHFFSE